MSQIPTQLGVLEPGREIIQNASPLELSRFIDDYTVHLSQLDNSDYLFMTLPPNLAMALLDAGILQIAAKVMGLLLTTDIVVVLDNESGFYNMITAPKGDFLPGQLVFDAPFVEGEIKWSDLPRLGMTFTHAVIEGGVNDGEVNDGNLPVDEINHNASASRFAFLRRAASSLRIKVPKPRNSWIIYRSDKHKKLAEKNRDKHTSEISTEIAAMWKSESQAVKDHYKLLADVEKEEHSQMHPGYKCTPRKSSEIKKRKTARARQVSGESAASVDGEAPDDELSRLRKRYNQRVATITERNQTVADAALMYEQQEALTAAVNSAAFANEQTASIVPVPNAPPNVLVTPPANVPVTPPADALITPRPAVFAQNSAPGLNLDDLENDVGHGALARLDDAYIKACRRVRDKCERELKAIEVEFKSACRGLRELFHKR